VTDSPAIPEASDPLGEALHLLRLQGTLYCQSQLSAPWGIDIPPLAPQMSFVVLTQGRGWLIVEGNAPHLLEPGTLTLIPHGARHRLVSDVNVPAVPLFDLPIQRISERYERVSINGGGELSQATYGVMRFEHGAATRLIAALPSVVRVEPWADESGWMQSTLRLIEREARALRPGGETVITRLADILVIQAIRAWLDSAPEARQGWFAALRDPHIGRALALMHKQPQREMDVISLAKHTGMSRSAFSARFSELLGESPMRYLTRWRLDLAHANLRKANVPLAELAVQSGYQSDVAFCRAFKREFGVTPASVRRD
jgi:AraC-like DNA-binding protein